MFVGLTLAWAVAAVDQTHQQLLIQPRERQRVTCNHNLLQLGDLWPSSQDLYRLQQLLSLDRQSGDVYIVSRGSIRLEEGTYRSVTSRAFRRVIILTLLRFGAVFCGEESD